MRRNVNRNVFNDRKNVSATIVGSAYVYPLDTRMRRNVNRKGFNDRKNVSATPPPNMYLPRVNLRQITSLRSYIHPYEQPIVSMPVILYSFAAH